MISIIIPTLNEAGLISDCIRALRAEAPDAEIIVADGGSLDGTKEIAGGIPGTRIIDAGKGRGIQMNRGAAEATGDILLFVHADTTLETGWSQGLLSALDNATVAGGAFTFSIRGLSWKYRLVEAWVGIRSALCRLPYGDQGIFIRKNVFAGISGYREIPLMEDVDLISRVRRIGRIVIIDKKAFTSERRWTRKGLLRTALTNQIIMLLYLLGVDPQRLYRIYYR